MQLKKFLLLLFFLCLCSPKEAFCKSKQPVSLPEYDPEVFVESAINVYSTITSDFVTLTADDCKYIFPTNVRAKAAWCDKSCFKKPTEVCTNWSSSESVNYTKECLCARQVTVCDKKMAINGIELGCVMLLPLPMPPTFFETLGHLPRVTVVPVRSSDYMHPKLRVVISTSNDMSTYNVDYPDPTDYKSHRQVLHSEGGKAGPIVVERRLTRGKICAKVVQVFGRETEAQLEHCFNRYGSTNYSGLRICESGSGLCIDNKTIPYFRPLIIKKEERDKCAGPLCQKGFFVGGYICIENKSEGSDNEKTSSICGDGKFSIGGEGDLRCQNEGVEVCPSGYQVKLRYVNDLEGNLLCPKDVLSLPQEYMTVVNDRVRLFRENIKKFVPYKIKDGESVPSEEHALDIPHTEQSVLDNLTFNRQTGFYKAESKARVITYRYEEQVVFCLEGDLDKKGGCNRPFYSLEHLSQGVQYATTRFSNFKGVAFFLPNDYDKNKYSLNQCGGGPCYVPATPLHKGLCFFEKEDGLCHDYRAIIDSPEKGGGQEVKAPNDREKGLNSVDVDPFGEGRNSAYAGCDMVEIEALGGGSVGTSSSGGNSGEYVAVRMITKDFMNILTSDKVLLPIVGLGGGEKADENDGGDSILYVCDKDSFEKHYNERVDGDKDEKCDSGSSVDSDSGCLKADHYSQKYLKEHCSILIAARGGKARQTDAPEKDAFNRFGSEFEDRFVNKIYKPSIAGKMALSQCLSSVPYYDLKTRQPSYTAPEEAVCTVLEHENEEQKNALAQAGLHPDKQWVGCKKSAKYGRGGCPAEYCVQGKPGSPDKVQQNGGAGVIRVRCQTFKK
ncbi:hypothetical protein [Neorickettsia sennetsu]|uniref:Uncharacterized protein n=1 Tax=Ehrlichia sennetsu (strain ATCC VR-367 / Miyayama) TaxID=222891 RepID=Q2GD06_EHRS3|nr:hypothetical protein [Neorickettsia sennetsu]ABD46333.1 hypothetical protein NSE_0765 [Neorickettsia sennetsu str. Miyayama]